MKRFIELLRDQGELLTVSHPLDPRHEISTVLSELGKNEHPAILVEKVKGYSLPVIGNLLGTRKRISMALGINPDHLSEEAIPKIEDKRSPVLISDLPSKDRITKKKGIELLKILPVLTHYSKDSGPFITSGITSAKDPLDGTTGRGLHRMEVRGKNLLGISLMTPPLSEIYARCKKENRKMEIATVIGVHPAILVASVLRVPAGTDKLSVAGGLMGQPVPVVTAKTVELNIPAHAEITLEGIIDPRGKEKDGVLGESSGYYMSLPNSPTIHITAITYRKSACFHAILPWGLEVDHLLSFIHGIDFIPKMRKEIPSLRRVHFVSRTFGSHVVMSLDSDNKGEIRRALTLALSFPMIKKAIAVGSDVDPEDIHEVEWSLATRFQADRDMIVLTGIRGSAIDPSSRERVFTTKVGMDATRPKKEGFEKVEVPEDVKRRLAPLLNKFRRSI
ncbi:MAG: hypothetical protein A2162_04470 [Deltaproteobacteria bacterium RBG_13_52_11b]|nr:MAG: hypothetical protein A2162_04470 [Deltaproteobacteria bacterium RBG_13_52_11b]